ncbi:MAG: ABC transporter ATP-binding protein [Rhodospirillales bacterium]|nr:ABC transporter ATP-binding protein [Rhodospirillales bacterium]
MNLSSLPQTAIDRIAFVLRTAFGLLPAALRPRLYWLFPLMLVAALLEMIGLALIVPLVNAVAGDGPAATVPVLGRALAFLGELSPERATIALAAAIAAFYLVKNAVLFLAIYAENSLILSAVTLTAAGLLRVYLDAPYPFHLRHNSAELIRNLNLSVEDTFRSVLKSVLRLILELLVVTGTLLVLVLADPGVTLAVGGGFALFLGLFVAFTHRRIAGWGRRLQSLHKAAFQSLTESLGLVKEIKVLGREPFFAETYARLRREMGRIHVLHQSVFELPRLSIETLLVAAFVLALVLVSARGQETRDVLPLLALYAFAGFRLMPSFNRIIMYANTIRFGAPALEQVARHHAELRRLRPPVPPSRATPAPFASELAFEGVTFRYENAALPAVDGVSFSIARGRSLGLVGASGSGKTTLVNILLGLLEPQAGRLRADGRDVFAELSAWQRRIGFIPQDVLLLDDSLRRNIALGVDDGAIDQAALGDALRFARLESLVGSLPEGLDTVAGERGARLSGGQRQRVGIARALYHRPEILVMDEATSALDNETEREIADALAELRGRLTIIIIAHRLSTVRHCDTLVFMKEGRVAGHGTFEELYRRNADFRRMVDLGKLGARTLAAS